MAMAMMVDMTQTMIYREGRAVTPTINAAPVDHREYAMAPAAKGEMTSAAKEEAAVLLAMRATVLTATMASCYPKISQRSVSCARHVGCLLKALAVPCRKG